MNKQRSNEKGFTMVELIIVVAIMGIIGALLVPAFGTMSMKARISTDIATTKTIKRTAEAFKAEQGSWPAATNLAGLSTSFSTSNYFEATMKLQVPGADISFDSATGAMKLNLAGATDAAGAKKALSQIDASTRSEWVVPPS